MWIKGKEANQKRQEDYCSKLFKLTKSISQGLLSTFVVEKAHPVPFAEPR